MPGDIFMVSEFVEQISFQWPPSRPCIQGRVLAPWEDVGIFDRADHLQLVFFHFALILYVFIVQATCNAAEASRQQTGASLGILWSYMWSYRNSAPKQRWAHMSFQGKTGTMVLHGSSLTGRGLCRASEGKRHQWEHWSRDEDVAVLSCYPRWCCRDGRRKWRHGRCALKLSQDSPSETFYPPE